ncbi:galactose mutarotase [Toxorhynchites rutilus septentrionalis]|uniref:galactose mutarotase n=1 Tax=Toxorhynchites rutilus septentrionalis TaxID=329112 RepID=UPI002478C332|nr:galactose mutarotase [Toxorhynchites rutilus septentrionalis]
MSEHSGEPDSNKSKSNQDASSVTVKTMDGSLYSEVESVALTVDGFGTVKDPLTGEVQPVRRFTWSNDSGMTVQVISYGAIITSIKVPGMDGTIADVVLGFDHIPGYQMANNPYFGATVGRVANRIGGAKFTLEGVEYQVTANMADRHQLHGGKIGFDKFNWIPHVEGTVVTLSHTNMDEHEGYPGTVLASVTYELKKDNRFVCKFRATASKPTPINLTNHSYFNLAGHHTGHEEIYRHIISVNADRITETDEDSIPTGEFICVGGTPYDLRIPRELGPAMSRAPGEGFDNNFCITKGTEQTMTFAARVTHPHSGRVLEVYTDQPGVQLYTSNSMPDPNRNIRPKPVNAPEYYDVTRLEPVVGSMSPEQPIKGKGGAKYFKHGAFCLETQNYPDAVNHANFPNSILVPGETYNHEVVYKFGLCA